MSIQQNEMFILGLSSDELNSAIESKDYPVISKHLYRVQKVQSKDYTFRHHLETKIDDSKVNRETKKFIRVTNIKTFNGIKVRVNSTNKVTLIND